ncbi:hypothetical protein AFLA_006960 [Aspergillus flavus NRRL3357]|nr:hypothetical protein AFLA_006960 [Aspergillus flavus NRRL3357]
MYCRSISSQISEPARATLTTSHTAGVLDYVAVSPTTFNTGLLLCSSRTNLRPPFAPACDFRDLELLKHLDLSLAPTPVARKKTENVFVSKRSLNDNCFACGTEIIQVAHVIAKSAPSVPLLQQRGLINFDLRGL